VSLIANITEKLEKIIYTDIVALHSNSFFVKRIVVKIYIFTTIVTMRGG